MVLAELAPAPLTAALRPLRATTGFSLPLMAASTHQLIPGQAATAALVVAAAAGRVVPKGYLAVPVVQMVPPVAAGATLAEPDRARLLVNLVKQPANSIPAAVERDMYTTADTMQLVEPVAQAAAAMAQSCMALAEMERLTLEAAEAAGLITSAIAAPVVRAEAAARASSVCAYTKNKHGLRFGGRERRVI